MAVTGVGSSCCLVLTSVLLWVRCLLPVDTWVRYTSCGPAGLMPFWLVVICGEKRKSFRLLVSRQAYTLYLEPIIGPLPVAFTWHLPRATALSFTIHTFPQKPSSDKYRYSTHRKINYFNVSYVIYLFNPMLTICLAGMIVISLSTRCSVNNLSVVSW